MGATRQALPTVTGFAVKCAIAGLRQRGADPGPLLDRAGLAEGDLDTPRRRMSAAAQGEFLEYAALALNDPMFGAPPRRAVEPASGRSVVLRHVRG
jgi:hypothetical protein